MAGLRKQKVTDKTLQPDAEPSCRLAIVTGSIGSPGSVLSSQGNNVKLPF